MAAPPGAVTPRALPLRRLRSSVYVSARRRRAGWFAADAAVTQVGGCATPWGGPGPRGHLCTWRLDPTPTSLSGALPAIRVRQSSPRRSAMARPGTTSPLAEANTKELPPSTRRDRSLPGPACAPSPSLINLRINPVLPLAGTADDRPSGGGPTVSEHSRHPGLTTLSVTSTVVRAAAR